MKKYTAEELVRYMIRLFFMYVKELYACEDGENAQFIYGERTAYTECLEILRMWERAEACGFDFDIENIFPL